NAASGIQLHQRSDAELLRRKPGINLVRLTPIPEASVFRYTLAPGPPAHTRVLQVKQRSQLSPKLLLRQNLSPLFLQHNQLPPVPERRSCALHVNTHQQEK